MFFGNRTRSFGGQAVKHQDGGKRINRLVRDMGF